MEYAAFTYLHTGTGPVVLDAGNPVAPAERVTLTGEECEQPAAAALIADGTFLLCDRIPAPPAEDTAEETDPPAPDAEAEKTTTTRRRRKAAADTDGGDDA